MLFSVIIPLYNKAPYVAKAIQSVLPQTVTDYELIIVDDGSKDNSAEIAAQAIEGHSNCRLIKQENAGVSMARNNGVAASRGEYVCFLDADDWWEPTFLEEMAGLIERHPEAGIYGTSYYIVKNGRKRMAPIGVDNDFTEGEINYCQVYAKTLCMPLTSISVCIPRTVFDVTDGFPVDIKLGEDFMLWIQIALQHKVVLLNKPLSNYNQDSNPNYRGISRLHAPEKHFLWHINHMDANKDTKLLIDRLSAYALIPYYLSHQYHKDTLPLLQQIDWENIPPNIQSTYHIPLWIARAKQWILRTAVYLRDKMINKK